MNARYTLLSGALALGLSAPGQAQGDPPNETEPDRRSEDAAAPPIEDADHGGSGLRARDDRGDGHDWWWGRWARPGRPDLDRMFGDLFQRLEHGFDLDIPRRSFFHGDFFRDLQGQMRKQLGNVPGLEGTSNAMTLRVGPDGVVLEVEEQDASGETETKTYKAPDLETFCAEYPEIARRYLGGIGGGSGFGLRMPRLWKVWHNPSWRVLQRPPIAPAQPTPRTQVSPGLVPRSDDDGPRLGVYVRGLIGSDLRAFLGLDEGQGLMVERVQPDSLADRLGIEAGDIVLEIDGKLIGTPADVEHALRAAGEQVEVEVNRHGTVKTLRAEYGEGESTGELHERKA